MWERQLRAVACWVAFFTMIAFYLPVVTAIQALLQVGQCPCTTVVFFLDLRSRKFGCRTVFGRG